MLKQKPPFARIAVPGDLFGSDSAYNINVQITVAYNPGAPCGDGTTLYAGSCKVRDVRTGTSGMILDADGDHDGR